MDKKKTRILIITVALLLLLVLLIALFLILGNDAAPDPQEITDATGSTTSSVAPSASSESTVAPDVPETSEPAPSEPIVTEPGHTHSYSEEVTAATCTEDGYTTYVCQCGDSYTGGKVSATGHTFGEWVTTKEPSEAVAGEAIRSCANCEAEERKVLDKLIPNHTHSYTGKVTTAATCTAEGVQTFTCSCGSSYTESIAKGSHSYKATITKPACTEKGYTTYKCVACGDSYKDDYVAATGHHFGDYKSNGDATCTESGTQTRSCTCGASETRVLPPLGHQETALAGKNATCTEPGLTDGFHCSVCGKITVPQTTISALGHNYVNKVCSRCGDRLNTPSEGLQFSYSSYDNAYFLRGIGTCTDTHIIVPSTHQGLPVIGVVDFSFQNETSIESITLPDSIQSIGSSAFSGCTSLKSVVLPAGLQEIQTAVFSGCTALTDIVIPDSLLYVGERAFAQCSSLKLTSYSNAKYLASVSNAYHILLRADSTSISSCTIHSKAKVIASYALADCTSLKSITIPKNIVTINGWAFHGCTALSSVTIQNGVSSIENGAFEECTSLVSISIPDSVTMLSRSVFARCTSLKDVTLSKNITVIQIQTFDGCTALETLEIPGNVTRIRGYAFRNCTSLKSITLPGKVTDIDEQAFYSCSALNTVTIPQSVRFIGLSAFSNCPLKSINYLGTVSQWSAITIESQYVHPTVYCTDGTLTL